MCAGAKPAGADGIEEAGSHLSAAVGRAGRQNSAAPGIVAEGYQDQIVGRPAIAYHLHIYPRIAAGGRDGDLGSITAGNRQNNRCACRACGRKQREAGAEQKRGQQQNPDVWAAYFPCPAPQGMGLLNGRNLSVLGHNSTCQGERAQNADESLLL